MSGLAQQATGTRGRRPRADRIVGVDVARGIALITMASTHMLATHNDPTEMTAVGWLFSGRASALFALLAGVSLAIVTGGMAPREGLAGVIALIGLLLAMTDTPVAVILAYYGVYFLLAIPFLRLPARTLFVLAAVWAVVSPLVSHVVRGRLPDPPLGQVDVEMLLTDPFTALHALLFTGYYPAFTWLTYILAGLAVGRCDLRSRANAVRLAVVGAVLAVGAWTASTLLLVAGGADRIVPDLLELRGIGAMDLQQIQYVSGTTPTGNASWLLIAAPHSGTPFDLVGTTGSALCVLGLCLLLVRSSAMRTVTAPVAAAGAMTLTLYAVHVVLLALPVGEFDSPTYYLTHVAFFLIAPMLWFRIAPKGPLESLVHEISAGIGRAAVPTGPPGRRE
jgi:uncharacterized membrane protein